MRSSPQAGFSRANLRMILRRFGGSGGRPRFRDFHRQNCRNALRCHFRKVAGLTMTSAPRQSKNRARATIASRNIRVVLRGVAFRSWKSASCLRRNRFSATSAAREKKNRRRRESNTDSTRLLYQFRVDDRQPLKACDFC